MLSFVPFLALAGAGPVEQSLDRMQRFYAGAKTLDATFTLKSGGVTANARLRWSRPASQAFQITIRGERYEFRQNGLGVLELEHAAKRYVQFAARPTLVPPPGEVGSSGPSGYPTVLLDRSPVLSSIRQSPTRKHAKAALGTVSVDRVSAEFTSPVSTSRYELDIDAAGRLRRMRRTVQDRVSKHELVVEYVKTERNVPLATSLFSTTLPSGYTPERLPEMTVVSKEGARMPKVRCLDAATGKPVLPERLLGKGGALVLLSEQGSSISDRMAALLAKLAPNAKSRAVALVEIDVGTVRPKSKAPRPGFSARLWDSTGRFRKAFGVPGTPMALLYGNDAKLRQAWMGISQAEAGTIEEEMRGSLAQP